MKLWSLHWQSVDFGRISMFQRRRDWYLGRYNFEAAVTNDHAIAKLYILKAIDY